VTGEVACGEKEKRVYCDARREGIHEDGLV